MQFKTKIFYIYGNYLKVIKFFFIYFFKNITEEQIKEVIILKSQKYDDLNNFQYAKLLIVTTI